MKPQEYTESCTKYFAPIDEIIEAMDNKHGLSGMTYNELSFIVEGKNDLSEDIAIFREKQKAWQVS